MVTELTDQTFDEKTNNGVTFTDFWANMVWSLSYAISCYRTIS